VDHASTLLRVCRGATVTSLASPSKRFHDDPLRLRKVLVGLRFDHEADRHFQPFAAFLYALEPVDLVLTLSPFAREGLTAN